MRSFYDEMVVQGLGDKVTQFTLSDFSRTMNPAGSGPGVGSDHAWANYHFVVGGGITGKRFLRHQHFERHAFPDARPRTDRTTRISIPAHADAGFRPLRSNNTPPLSPAGSVCRKPIWSTSFRKSPISRIQISDLWDRLNNLIISVLRIS